MLGLHNAVSEVIAVHCESHTKPPDTFSWKNGGCFRNKEVGICSNHCA
jgi:hypothetical protein